MNEGVTEASLEPYEDSHAMLLYAGSRDSLLVRVPDF